MPVDADLEALMVMVEAPDPVMEVGLKDMVSPLPWPEAERLMAELKPPVAVVVTVTAPEVLRVTLSDVGEAETVKLAVTPEVTVSETAVVCVSPPPVPVMVML